MTPPDLDRLIQSWCDDCLTDSDAAELNGLLRASPQARERFREAARFHGLLHCAVSKWGVAGIADQAAHGAVSSQPGPLRAWLKWRTLASMAAGIALTLLCTDRGFGGRATRVLSQSALLEPRPDGEIRPGALPSGFPVKFGQWSGDESAIVAQPGAQGHALKHALLFKRAEREKSLTAGRAAACDVFRLVDLRAMKPVIAGGGGDSGALRQVSRCQNPARRDGDFCGPPLRVRGPSGAVRRPVADPQQAGGAFPCHQPV